MDQLREDAKLTDSGVGVCQLVKVSYWNAVYNCVNVHWTACLINSLPVHGACVHP